MEGVTHRYGRTVALGDVTLDLPRGALVGLIGPDGVGKSTLMGLVAGAKKLQAGRLEVLGGDMASAGHRRALAARIAYMPQGLGGNLTGDLSVAENLAFFGRLFGLSADERAARIAALTRATGLHAFLDRPAAKLSGGMKQKLGLCAALLHAPDLVLLDEPTTGVDPLSRRQFWELIARVRAQSPGLSLIVSTAYMDEAAGFDRLVAMKDGRVLAHDAPARLMERTGTASVADAFSALTGDGAGAGAAPPPLHRVDGEAAIRAVGLTRRFGAFTAVDDVSFEIHRGEIFGFLGSNGCGKTTTMKMLTGLLPPSAGAVALFGHPLDARDLQTRRRVGFMSQSFSLYGELSVAQNLALHARIFRLRRAEAEARIAELVAEFGLGAHLDTKAGDLPRGLAQRLSLAVAVIHRPEMLILDEPTSGVDPAARDGFWQHLIRLSREDGVTIFLSTHFMDEAERCDRISLMHAGRVLVSDTPARIVADSPGATLEDAFVHHIAAAGGAEAHLGAQAPLPAATARRRVRTGFDPGRLWAYFLREIKEVQRDPVRLAFAFLGTAVLLVIVSFGVSSDVTEVPYALLDQDRTPASRAYAQGYFGADVFDERARPVDEAALAALMRGNAVSLGLVIPPGFGRDLAAGMTPEVLALIDGTDTQRATTIESYVAGAHAHTVAAMGLGAGPPAVDILVRMRYNPTAESIYAIGPSIPPMLLILFPAILMAVSVAREKEIGTITNFRVTPTTRVEFLLGKQLVYVGVTLVNFALTTALVVWLLGVPLKGSLAALTLAAVVYAFAATGFGLIVAAIARTQVTAVFAGAILAMLPTISFSGLIIPVSALEGGARIIGQLWPTTYYLSASVGVFTKGLGLEAIAADIVALALFVPVFFWIGMAGLRKRET
jgi:ribosome-dependent ATPase